MSRGGDRATVFPKPPNKIYKIKIGIFRIFQDFGCRLAFGWNFRENSETTKVLKLKKLSRELSKTSKNSKIGPIAQKLQQFEVTQCQSGKKWRKSLSGNFGQNCHIADLAIMD